MIPGRTPPWLDCLGRRSPGHKHPGPTPPGHGLLRRLPSAVCLLFALLFAPGAWAACGDGLLEEGEQCDDGNQQSGDGCRHDCAGLERCGDGLLDFGEQCDDGNDLEDDGCSSACVAAASQPQSLAIAPQSLASEPAPAALAPPGEGERLQGLWRSTRTPLSLYEPVDNLPRDPKTARRHSVWATLAGYTLLSVGFVGPRLDQPSASRTIKLFALRGAGGTLAALGPSLGHLYVGEQRHAVRFSTYRLLLLASTATFFATAFHTQGTYAPALLSSGVLFFFTLRDIRDSGRAAKRHNQALEHRAQAAPLPPPESALHSPQPQAVPMFFR